MIRASKNSAKRNRSELTQLFGGTEAAQRLQSSDQVRGDCQVERFPTLGTLTLRIICSP